MATTATKLSQENIKNAKAAVTAYQNTANSLFTSLKGTVEALPTADFIGDASSGYQTFFQNITPALSTQITNLTKMLTDILTSVEQLLNPVDPELGQQNQNLTAQDAATTQTAAN